MGLKLTKLAVTQNGKTVYPGSDADAVRAYTKAQEQAIQPIADQYSVAGGLTPRGFGIDYQTGDVVSEADTTPDGLPWLRANEATQAGGVPQLSRPPFLPTMRDSAGNVIPVQRSDTKAGKLVRVLGLGLQGAADAAAGGALDAVPGRSAFGAGVAAAEGLPWVRAQRQIATQRANLENQELQARVALLPWQLAAAKTNQRRAQAQTDWYENRAVAADYKNVPGVGMVKINPDGSLAGIVPGTNAPERDTPEYRKQFVHDNPDLFPDADEARDYVLYGIHQPHQSAAPTRVVNGRVKQWNPNTSTYDLDLGPAKAASPAKPGAVSANDKLKMAGDAEGIAAQMLNRANGDPDAALRLFDQAAPRVDDPYQKKLGPMIRKSIQSHRRIQKPVSPIDKIVNDAIQGAIQQ